MKSILIKTVVIVLTFSFTPIHSQEVSSKKINEYYQNQEYAIISDSQLKKLNLEDKEVLKKMGDANFHISHFKKAAYFYEKLVKYHRETPHIYYFRYAQALKAIKEYNESDIWMKKFIGSSESNLKLTSEYLEELKKKPSTYKLKELAINSIYSDFTSSIANNYLIFASSSNTKSKIHKINNQSFLDMYKVDITSQTPSKNSIKKLKNSLNLKYHESNIIYSKDGKTIYFTRNNGFKKTSYSKNRINTLGLFRAIKLKGKWTKIEELDLGTKGYSIGHPALSPDEKTLYFTSDIPGGHGKTDLYKVTIFDSGKFGGIKNLGPIINTPGKEMFPFISKSGGLYFSSDYHNGFGGLDVFKASKSSNDYIQVSNLGQPINSSMDDFGYLLDETGQKGFFTSNRAGGIGDDDIYGFTKSKKAETVVTKPCSYTLEGVVMNKENKKTIPSALIIIVNSKGKELNRTSANKKGEFNFIVDCNTDYKLIASKEKYSNDEKLFSSQFKHIPLHIYLQNEEIPSSEIITNERGETIIDINPIYFNYNKFNIRPDAQLELNKVVAIMKRYSKINIIGTSHTDSRGKMLYNKLLSTNRAKSVVQYIINQGINPNRITAKGYGESRIKNRCTNYVKCSEEEHQQNRRTEFVVMNINDATNLKTLPSKTYKVKVGDTLYSIAKSNNLTLKELLELNELKSLNIHPGQLLKIR